MKKQNKDTVSKAATKPSGATVAASKKFSENKPIFLKYSRVAWKNYLEHQPEFAKLSSKFTAKMAEDELKALKKLEKLMQDSDLSIFRADVYEDLEALKLAFKSGVWYIKEAFPGNFRKLEEAGVPESAAFNYLKREKVAGYTSSFMAFLTKYKKELAANDNMPVSFPQEFNDLAKSSQRSLQNLNNAEASYVKKVKDLDAAFIERQTVMSKMLKAATEVIFPDNKELRNKFVIRSLEVKARAGGKTLLVGLVRLADSKKPIKNANVTIMGTPQYSALTDSAGKFKFEIEKQGTCKIKIKAPGYETYTITKKIKEGVQNRINVLLTPLDKPSLPEPVPAKRSKKAAADGVAA